MNKPKIAIIGAGISGIILARELHEVAQVKIFEKSRGIGGRMSTRYIEKFAFDHGAQFFSARTKAFQTFLKPFLINGDVVSWEGKVINIESDGTISPRFWFETHLVATPNMNSLCKKLASELDISLSVEVAPLKEKQIDGWHLQDKNGNNLGIFDIVISTAPQAQTANLFGYYFNVKQLLITPCYALMLGFNKIWSRDWIFAKVHNNPIKLIAVNSSKPGRNSEVTSIVVHSCNNWAMENIDLDQDEVKKLLLTNFTKVSKIDYSNANYIGLHRWRYALVGADGADIFIDKDLKLAATGDWASNSRIEDVWASAMKLASQLKSLIYSN